MGFKELQGREPAAPQPLSYRTWACMWTIELLCQLDKSIRHGFIVSLC